jgi:hypothetical protein
LAFSDYQPSDRVLGKMKTSNKLAAPNAAMTPLFQCGHHWRGIGEPERWTAHTLSYAWF